MDAALPLGGAVAWPTVPKGCHLPIAKHLTSTLRSCWHLLHLGVPGAFAGLIEEEVLPSALMLGGRARPGLTANLAIPGEAASFLAS